MNIIYDIDCLMYFLKNERTDLLEEEFDRIVISNKFYNSLNNPSIPDYIKDQLNSLLDKGFLNLEEISLNTETFDIYYEMVNEHKNQIIGDGEAASIAIAIKNNGTISHRNPRAIAEYIEKYNLNCITLEEIINNLYKNKKISKKEFEDLIDKSMNI